MAGKNSKPQAAKSSKRPATPLQNPAGKPSPPFACPPITRTCKDLVAHNLKILREERGLTVADVAPWLGMLPHGVTLLESGIRVLKSAEIGVLARHFEVDSDAFFATSHLKGKTS